MGSFVIVVKHRIEVLVRYRSFQDHSLTMMMMVEILKSLFILALLINERKNIRSLSLPAC